jgi:glycosyltransferase involved in cell wall biosynthesis
MFFNMEAKRLAVYERTLYKDFDKHIIISEQDRQRLKLPSKEYITVIPNGVDETFSSDDIQHVKSHDLVFVGNLGYGPNKAAAKFLVHDILPALNKQNRKVNLLIAGARPSNSIRRLASKKNVTVMGWVKDIREAYRDGRIFVAPMLSGLGLQNKILEAMSMGLPCVTTSLVNNAIGAKENEQILIADSVDDFAERILFLLDHPEAYKRIASQGKDFVSSNFKWEHQIRKMEEVINSENAYSSK